MSPIDVYARRFGPSYKWIATVTVMLGSVVCTAASTMINVALPDIMGAFGLSSDQIQWLSTGFLASMTATMLLTAWTLNRFGYRVSFIAALILFCIGSLTGALSASGEEVIFARVMQGFAAGLIQPMSMVVLSQVFPKDKRGQAMGIYTIGVVLAPAVGPFLAGFLIDEYNWRYVFFSIIPICIIAMAGVSVFLPGRDKKKKLIQFDLFGFIFLSAFLICLLYGVSNGQRYGWNSDIILFFLAMALITFIFFVIWELKCRMPLLAMQIFKNWHFIASCAVAFALGAGIYGSTYVVPLFVQLVQGYTPTRSGLLLMPAGVALAVISPISGRLGDRLPPWIPIMGGLALFFVSCWLSVKVDVDTSFLMLASWIVIGRIGLGLITPSLNAGALRALPYEQLAQGAGALNFIRQFGGAAGVNLISVFIDRQTTFHADALAQMITAAPSAAAESIRSLSLMLTEWGNPFGTRLPMGVPPSALEYLETMIVPKARLFAYQDAFLALSIMFLVSLIPAFLMRKKSI